MHSSAAVVLLLGLMPRSSSAVFQEGPCKILPEQQNQEMRNFFVLIHEAEESLLPVLITAPEEKSYSATAYSSRLKTSYHFSAAFGDGHCLDKFTITAKGKNERLRGFFINNTVIEVGNAFVEHTRDSFEWLVYFCQDVYSGKVKGHVAHLWVFQRVSIASKSLMKKSRLLNQYGDFIERVGIEKRHLLSLADNDYTICDEDFFHMAKTAVWYRVVAVMLIFSVLITATGWTLNRLHKASKKVREVRQFSDQ